MTDLERRSLDEALARAMGWKPSQQYGWGLWDMAEGGLEFPQSWHASLDALLRDIEPVCRERGMVEWSVEWVDGAHESVRCAAYAWLAGKGGDRFTGDEHAPTAATALARAFLAVLTR